MPKSLAEIDDITIQLQIFADNYAKAKMSHSPSVNMGKELRKLEALINRLIAEAEERGRKSATPTSRRLKNLEGR